uniref:Uncharacterized protein n=1 Tax=Arundo donax TaxID=35708 RepID=A0A0A9EIH6_ARUDO
MLPSLYCSNWVKLVPHLFCYCFFTLCFLLMTLNHSV